MKAGNGASAGAAVYPLRTLVRDAIERVIQLELSRWLDRTDSPPDSDAPNGHEREDGALRERDGLGVSFANWLYSENSPLLLQNIPDYVLNPKRALQAISERVDGPGHLINFTGREVTGISSFHEALEFRARIKSFAELNAERILATPRRRGTPKGKTRTHYVWLILPDRDISNRDFKELISEIVQRRWPDARVLGYIHRDTDNTHLHLWISAEQTSRKKINVGKVRQTDGTFVDKYRDIDEEVSLAFSQHFNDPSIYEDHIAKKQEWIRWKERFEKALAKGERPPVMPFRARHDYDYVAERIALARREQPEEEIGCAERKKSPPMPRTKSLIGALELWGKTIYLQSRVSYRQELLKSLDAWQQLIEHPIDGIRQYFEQQLSKAEQEYQEYRKAFDKTLENRAAKSYPELKYALHNSRQIAEMQDMAWLTHDAELLRYVHSYTLLDKSEGREELSREIGDRWRDLILAMLGAHEFAEQLERVALVNSHPVSTGSIGDSSNTEQAPFDSDWQIIKGWLHGDWSTQQMRGSLACIENEATMYHAERYVKAREYMEATQEILIDYRKRAERLIAHPSLEDSQLSRIKLLLERDVAKQNQEERDLLRDMAVFTSDGEKITAKRFESLLERSLTVGSTTKDATTRASDTPDDLSVLKPQDAGWVGRLTGVTVLRETKALALVMHATSVNELTAARDGVGEKRDLMNLAESIRTAWGQTNDTPTIRLSLAEQRELESHRQFITEHIQLHDLGWSARQIEIIRELARCLPLQEQEKLSRALERAQLQVEKEQRREEIEKLREQLDLVAQFYVRKIYQIEGLQPLRDATRLDALIADLTEGYLHVIEDRGKNPEQFGFNEEKLRAKARVTLAVSVDRFEREEQEINDLSRLEARVILAEQASAVSIAHREHFEDHCYFINWHYQTIGERHPGRISLAEAKLEYAEQISLGERGDLARIMVLEDAGEHIVRNINEEVNRLRRIEEQNRNEFLLLNAQYQERLRAHEAKGLSKRDPKFTPEKFEKLGEYAEATRNVELSGFISRIEEAEFGPIYAARRCQGRALVAGVIEHNEFTLVPQYNNPLDLSKHPYLSPQLHAELTEALHRHTERRASEKSSAFAYSRSLEKRADELKGKCTPKLGEMARPFVMPREANTIFNSFQAMSTHARYRWEQKLQHVQVADTDINKKSPSEPDYRRSQPVLFEWAAKTQIRAAYTLNSSYERGLGETRILSYREAQGIVRAHYHETQRNTPAPNRSRGR